MPVLDGLWDSDLKGLNGSMRPQEPEPALQMTQAYIDCRASDLEGSKHCCSRGLRLR